MLNWSDPFPLDLAPPIDALRITATSLHVQPISLKKLQEAAILRKLNQTTDFRLI